MDPGPTDTDTGPTRDISLLPTQDPGNITSYGTQPTQDGGLVESIGYANGEQVDRYYDSTGNLLGAVDYPDGPNGPATGYTTQVDNTVIQEQSPTGPVNYTEFGTTLPTDWPLITIPAGLRETGTQTIAFGGLGFGTPFGGWAGRVRGYPTGLSIGPSYISPVGYGVQGSISANLNPGPGEYSGGVIAGVPGAGFEATIGIPLPFYNPLQGTHDSGEAWQQWAQEELAGQSLPGHVDPWYPPSDPLEDTSSGTEPYDLDNPPGPYFTYPW